MAKTAKNLLGNRDVYNRYYANFRGVDFSNDHTMVNPQRFAYLVNMFKDYQSEQGKAIETIPGFRLLNGSTVQRTVLAMHTYATKDGTQILIHAKKDNTGYLYVSCVKEEDTNKPAIVPPKTDNVLLMQLTVNISTEKSSSFRIGNDLLIIDGSNLWTYDGTAIKAVEPYIPTTYADLVPGGEVSEREYEQANLLTAQFKNTFVADGETKEFYLSTKANTIVSVKNYDDSFTCNDENLIKDTTGDIIGIKFSTAPVKPQDKSKPEGYAGIEITATATGSTPDKIKKCTIGAVFDNRLFLSGNPDYPNTIFWSQAKDGDPDITYFGELNYVQDGVENNAPITSMLSVANKLMVLKTNAKSDGAVYFHARNEVEDNIVPVTYPAERGLNGTGCLGASCNFLDDPVFISRLGVEAMGQLSVRYERAIEHRSSLVDAKLTNLNLEKAVLEEWNGYLIVLVDGEIFMADSRQKYTDELGIVQYEWYYLNDIGVYEGQYENYFYASEIPDALKNISEFNSLQLEVKTGFEGRPVLFSDKITRKRSTVSYPTQDNKEVKIIIPYTEETNEAGTTKRYFVDWRGDYIGGTFDPAVVIKEIDGNLFFCTGNGSLCCFNFDERETESKEIRAANYTFNNRAITSGCATKMDNCDVPHLTKSTVKKSMVVKTKTRSRSAAKIKVRTNNDPYKQVARINTALFSFLDMDFSDFTFVLNDDNLFVIKEKEKKWMEKQIFIYSDEFQAPFALHYIAYRYTIAGRLKN